jgi:uncharacterized Fe-S cluster-containing radical SAM superfamily protein
MAPPLRSYRVTSRFVLHVGTACNQRCEFCYYRVELERHQGSMLPSSRLKRQIAVAARLGKRAVDISGGEPTLRADLPCLVERCRRQGLDEVRLITNGLLLAEKTACRRLQEAGLTEGLFSLHGATAEEHDRRAGAAGSFFRLLDAIANFSSLGLGFRINTVVDGRSVPALPDLLRRAGELGAAGVNLLVFNPSETAGISFPTGVAGLADLAGLGRRIGEALDANPAILPRVAVRFLPMCALPRHLEAVRTLWQKVHEDREWDPFLQVAFRKGWPAALAAAAVGTGLGWRAPRYRPADALTRLSRSLSAFRARRYYRHGAPCRACSARGICPGVQREVAARHGFPALQPLELGAILHDPLHFLAEHADEFASLREQP